MNDANANGPSTIEAPGTDLLIVWHSRTGASRQLSLAAHEGACRGVGDGNSDHRPVSRRIGCESAGPDDLLNARACLFVCPENLASMTGEMKAFFDRCYYPVLDRIQGRAFAVIISAGSDGQGASQQIQRIAKGWRLRMAAEPLIVNMRAQTPAEILAQKTVPEEALAQAADIGQALAEAAAMGAI
ncbi:MAG: NAD(P)H-dependent oxidoreductase [Burkholderiaceae bacterium]